MFQKCLKEPDCFHVSIIVLMLPCRCLFQSIVCTLVKLILWWRSTDPAVIRYHSQWIRLQSASTLSTRLVSEDRTSYTSRTVVSTYQVKHTCGFPRRTTTSHDRCLFELNVLAFVFKRSQLLLLLLLRHVSLPFLSRLELLCHHNSSLTLLDPSVFLNGSASH